CSRGVVFFDNW
nr:immunoglobulin heavy chain junction region [Macaca mulatta]